MTSIQYFTTEEQVTEAARDLTRLPTGCCFHYIAGQGVTRIQLPLANQVWQGLPRFAAKKISALRAAILARPEFDSLDDLLQQRIEFEQRLVEFLHEIRHSDQQISMPTVLLVPATPANSIITI